MVQKLNREQVAEKARIHTEPQLRKPTEVDRSFELPTRIYAVTVGLLFAYLAVMWTGFSNPELILPMAIFFLFVAAAFGVPALWTRMKPENPVKALAWERFKREGIMTASGRLSARDATIQVVLMPVMILIWGFAVVTIAAIS